MTARATRLRDVGAGLVSIVVVVALITLSIKAYDRDFSSTTKVSLTTDSIGSSLQKGSDVEVRGIPIGVVTGVHTNGDGARLDLALSSSAARRLPADLTAELLPKTLFGERYVSLVLPTSASGPILRAGAVIHQDESSQGAELQQVFDSLLPVLQAVQPEKLSLLLGELAQTLQGRGTELGTTVATFTSFLRGFAPDLPAFDADLTALGSVANTYATAAPDLISALDSFTVSSKTVVDDRQQLADLFGSVTTASNTVGGFLTVNQSTIISLTRDSLPTLTVLAKYSSEFPCISRALSAFVPVAAADLGAGTSQPGLHVNLQVVPSLGKYLPGQASTPTGTGTASCPVVIGSPTATPAPAATTRGAPTTAPASTLVSAAPLPAAAGTAAGIGTANSPAENAVIAELVAPTLGLAPASFPAWGSLLLGPSLRGSQVTVR